MSKIWTPDNAGKVIPVVRVRPLLPPPLQIGARLEPQHMHWQLGHYVEDLSFGPGGRGRRKRWVVDREAEQHNIVLTQTYDSLIPVYGFLSLNTYAVVGTGSTPPDPTQTGLANERVRTLVTPSGDISGLPSVNREANGVYKIAVAREFTESQVGNANLTEWGFSPSGSSGANLMSRELFRDGNGTPIVITPASDQRLRLIYAIRLSISPVVAVPHTIDISGIGLVSGLFIMWGGYSGMCPHSDLAVVNGMARGSNTVQIGGCVYNLSLLVGESRPATSYGGNSQFYGNNRSASKGIQYAAYVQGSRQRKTTPITYLSSEANYTIRGIVISGESDARLGANFAIDESSAFTKTDLYKLTIGEWTLAWGP